MRRWQIDRFIVRKFVGCLLIIIGIITILSYIPVWIWLSIIGTAMIVLGCIVLRIWE